MANLKNLARCVLAAGVAATGSAALAQAQYPTKPVRLVVASSPGGGTDTTARIIAPGLSELLGQQMVVENRPGAASMIGSEHVARSAPDGYTLLIVASTIIIVPSTYRKLRFDPIKDFAPVSKIVVVPQLLVSHPSLPAKNLRELIAFTKSRPGQLDYGAGAYGGHPHMSMALFLIMAGLNVTHVAYKSGNAGLVDTLAGEVPLMMGNVLTVLQHVRSGRLRAYGITSVRRAQGLPDIPTIAEAGVPGYDSSQWFGMLAPAATPREIVNRLHRGLVRVIQDTEVRSRFLIDGGEPEWSPTPDDFAAFMRADLAKWAKVVKDTGLTQQ